MLPKAEEMWQPEHRADLLGASPLYLHVQVAWCMQCPPFDAAFGLLVAGGQVGLVYRPQDGRNGLA